MKKGFTLIELLVVVLIIGILAAIALPMYQKSVARARFSGAAITMKAIKDAQERYYLAHGSYASKFSDLDITLTTEAVGAGGSTGDINSGLIIIDGFAYGLDAAGANTQLWDERDPDMWGANNHVVYYFYDKSPTLPGRFVCMTEGDQEMTPGAKICETWGFVWSTQGDCKGTCMPWQGK